MEWFLDENALMVLIATDVRIVSGTFIGSIKPEEISKKQNSPTEGSVSGRKLFFFRKFVPPNIGNVRSLDMRFLNVHYGTVSFNRAVWFDNIFGPNVRYLFANTCCLVGLTHKFSFIYLHWFSFWITEHDDTLHLIIYYKQFIITQNLSKQ